MEDSGVESGGLEVTRVPGLVGALEISSRSGDLVLDTVIDASGEKDSGGLTGLASSGDVMDLRTRRNSALRRKKKKRWRSVSSMIVQFGNRVDES